MQIYASNKGGFGNVVFTHFAAILFTILFDAEMVHINAIEEQEYYMQNFKHINDEHFLQIINERINNQNTIIDLSEKYVLVGLYQHDTIYLKYKTEIIKYITDHPEIKIFTSHYPWIYHYKNIIEPKQTKKYDIAIHVRLGDFVELGWTMNPHDMKNIIDMLPIKKNTTVAIVTNETNKVVDSQYIRYIQELIPNSVLEMHMNPMIDYNILRNAKQLVCSCSTLSWIASIFGRKNQIVYFPNYKPRWNHETFRKPHNRVLYYDFTRSYQVELWDILRDVRKIIKTETPRILFLETATHHKNLYAINNYKNIHLHTIHSMEEFSKLDLLFYDAVFSPSNAIEVNNYPNIKFIFGPHFSVFPESHSMDKIRYKNAIYIQPSQWAADIWNNMYPMHYEVLPWGVDTVKFMEIKPPEEKELVFIYFKARKPEELEFLENELRERNISYRVFGYGQRYNEEEYVDYLKNAKYGIWLDAHESQGFALEEALSCNVPLLVWNVRFMSQEYNSSYADIPATTIPYWDERCGEYFYNSSDFAYMFGYFMENIHKKKYQPRKYILEHLAMEVCEKRLIKYIQNDVTYWK